MGLVQGIHHISMKCCNEEEEKRVIQFYHELLGLEIIRRWDSGFMLNSGTGLIEIFTNGDKPLDKGIIRHIALAVSDVDECVNIVRNAGYQVFIEPNDIEMNSDPVFRARMAFCIGPLGEEIEFFKEQ